MVCKNPRPRGVKYSLDDLKDVPVGGTVVNEGGCVGFFASADPFYDEHRKNGFQFPANGEFVYDRSNLGPECVDDYCFPLKHFPGTLKRVSFSGDVGKCCTSGNEIVDGKTCAPDLRDLSSGTCFSHMQSHCAEPENSNSSRCTAWREETGNEDALRGMDSFCATGDNIATSACRDHCSKNNRSACDVSARAWCKSHPDNSEFCGCLNTQKFSLLQQQLSNRGFSLIPTCHIKECTENPLAYKPVRDRGVSCPTLQVCLQNFSVEGVGGSAALNNIEMTCESELKESSSTKTDVTSSTVSETSEEDTTPKPYGFSVGDRMQWLVIGLVVFVFLFVWWVFV